MMDAAMLASKIADSMIAEGGAGSGHFGHKGRPGIRGGSLPGGGSGGGTISARRTTRLGSTAMAQRFRAAKEAGSIGGVVGYHGTLAWMRQNFPGHPEARYVRAVAKAGIPVPRGTTRAVSSTVMSTLIRRSAFLPAIGAEKVPADERQRAANDAFARLQQRYPGQASRKYAKALVKAGFTQSEATSAWNNARVPAAGAITAPARVNPPAAKPGGGVLGIPRPRPPEPPAQSPEAIHRGRLAENFHENLKQAAAAAGMTADIQSQNRRYYTVNYKKNGEQAGYSIFSLNANDGTGYIDRFFMKDGQQGTGLGVNVIKSIVDHAVNLGIRKIDLLANGRDGIGRYAWAVMGFDFKHDHAGYESRFKSYLTQKGVPNVDQLSFKHSWEIAAFVHEGRKLGKSFLIGHIASYNATFSSRQDSTSRAVLDNYIAGKKAKKVESLIWEGGAGSGNWGHRGRPGLRGGSLPRGSGSSVSAHVSTAATVSSEKMSNQLKKAGIGTRSAALDFIGQKFGGQDPARIERALRKAGINGAGGAAKPAPKATAAPAVAAAAEKVAASPAPSFVLGKPRSVIEKDLKGKPLQNLRPLKGGAGAGVTPTYIVDINGYKGVVKTMRNKGGKEVAAYELDKMIGFGVVPPTVFRDIDVGDGKGPQKCSVMLFVEGKIGQDHVKSGGKFKYDDMAKMTAFDYIMGNQDRHPANYVVDTKGKAWAIDNALSWWTRDAIVSSTYPMVQDKPIPANVKAGVKRFLANKTAISKQLETYVGRQYIKLAMERAQKLLTWKDFDGSKFEWPPRVTRKHGVSPEMVRGIAEGTLWRRLLGSTSLTLERMKTLKQE